MQHRENSHIHCTFSKSPMRWNEDFCLFFFTSFANSSLPLEWWPLPCSMSQKLRTLYLDDAPLIVLLQHFIYIQRSNSMTYLVCPYYRSTYYVHIRYNIKIYTLFALRYYILFICHKFYLLFNFIV